MAWDVTVPSIGDTATEAGAAENKAVANEIAKYHELASTNVLPSYHRSRGDTSIYWAVELYFLPHWAPLSKNTPTIYPSSKY